MKEANIQTLFGKWLKGGRFLETTAFELKLCKQKAIPLNSVKEHQVEGLLQAKKGLYHKISDSPIFAGQQTRFNAKKPFDCLWIKAKEAYVAICWYIPRKPKYLHLIPIDEWIKITKTHKRKSIREEEVEGVSYKIKL